MLKIYKYDASNDEYRGIVNATMKGREKSIALDEWIIKNGEEVSIKGYFGDTKRKTLSRDGTRYKCFGKPENCIEKLAYEEFEFVAELSYCEAQERYPEYLVEGRTDWQAMKEYADNLYYFLEDLKSEIANGVFEVNVKKR